MRRCFRNIRLVFLFFCILPLAGCAASSPVDRARLAPLVPVEPSETMEVFYFRCGKADSMLICQGEHAMLIDAATEKEGRNVVARLQEEGIRKLDVLLVTHEDKDHVGGADHVLRALEVERVYVGQITENTKQLRQFDEALGEQGMQATTLVAGDHFALGSALVTVIGPVSGGPRSENDASLVLRVDFGQTAFLFAADAEDLSLGEMLYGNNDRRHLRAHVLKVPHHGRAAALSTLFLEAVGPQIAVITCDRGDKENLPEAAVVDALERAGAQVYVTGDGEVKVVSDGVSVVAETRLPK